MVFQFFLREYQVTTAAFLVFINDYFLPPCHGKGYILGKEADPTLHAVRTQERAKGGLRNYVPRLHRFPSKLGSHTVQAYIYTSEMLFLPKDIFLAVKTLC